jgi:probable rRNA maturation factor
MTSRPDRRRPRASLRVAVVAAAGDWSRLLPDAPARCRRAARAALAGRLDGPSAITVMLADDAALRDLNRTWRAEDKPTNVLSFPDGAADETGRRQLGDLALAAETLVREAAEQGKALADHFSHLVVHGALHLIGYDHEDDGEAEVMEALERRVLAGIGIADPYEAAR